MASVLGSGPKAQATLAALRKISQKTKMIVLNRSAAEQLTEEATNGDPWGPTGPQMNAVADASFDAEKFEDVWKVLTKQLGRAGEDWRRVYKAQLLLEHMVKHSSQHVVQVVLDQGVPILDHLQKFEYKDEGGKDWGINVRNRAKEICALLARPDRIREERQKARANKEKYREALASTPAGAGTQSVRGSGGAAGKVVLPPRAGKAAAVERNFGGGSWQRGGDDETNLKGSWEGHINESMTSAFSTERLQPTPRHPTPAAFAETLTQDALLEGSAPPPVQVATKPTLRELAHGRPGAPKKLQDIKVNPNIAASFVGLSKGGGAAPVALTASSTAQPALQVATVQADKGTSVVGATAAGDQGLKMSHPSSRDFFQLQWDSEEGAASKAEDPFLTTTFAAFEDDPFTQLASQHCMPTTDAAPGPSMRQRAAPKLGDPVWAQQQPKSAADPFADFNPLRK